MMMKRSGCKPPSIYRCIKDSGVVFWFFFFLLPSTSSTFGIQLRYNLIDEKSYSLQLPKLPSKIQTNSLLYFQKKLQRYFLSLLKLTLFNILFQSVTPLSLMYNSENHGINTID